METLLINVPEQKSSLVKQLLKELGVTIENQTKARKLAEEINQSIKSGPKPGLDEIVAEVNAFRSGQ
jgi:ABC-type hemin transport system substrate-binding protein